VRAGQNPHAAVVAVAVGQREPDRDEIVRFEPEIRRILVPGHVGSVVAALHPEPRGEDQDVGSDQVLDDVENVVAQAEPAGPAEAQMPFHLEVARRRAGRAPEALEIGAHLARFRGGDAVEGREHRLAFVAVAVVQRRLPSHGLQQGTRRVKQRFLAFDAVHFEAQRAQDGTLVPAACPNFQDGIPRLGLEQLALRLREVGGQRRGRGFGLHITPLDVSEIFQAYRDELDAAWVFTSATLSVKGDFSHFTDALGLEDGTTLCLESPFDYANNALLWLPDLPLEPRDPRYIDQLMDQLVPASYLQLEDTVRNVAIQMRIRGKPPVLTYKELRWVMS